MHRNAFKMKPARLRGRMQKAARRDLVPLSFAFRGRGHDYPFFSGETLTPFAVQKPEVVFDETAIPRRPIVKKKWWL